MQAALAAQSGLLTALPEKSPAASPLNTSWRAPAVPAESKLAVTAGPDFFAERSAIAIPQEQELTGFTGLVNRMTQKAFIAGAWGFGLTMGEIAVATVTSIGGSILSIATGLVWPKAGELMLAGTAKILDATIAMLPYTAIGAAALVGSWLLLYKLDEMLSGPKDF